MRDLVGYGFCKAYASAADEWLSEILEKATGGDERGVALVAVGGYGRGELSPGSDLDVVLVHEGRSGVDNLAQAVWYPVWNDGVHLDHSVRSPKEVLRVARSDMRAMLGLLDARHVAGDSAVSGPLTEAALELWRNSAERFIPELVESIVARHEVQGDVAFLLEPDLKDAHGGLRDLHAIRAVLLSEGAEPHIEGVLAPGAAEEVLLAARVELQRKTGRAINRLVLQEQDAVAAALGYEDADALMARVSEAGRTIAWNLDYMLHRVELRRLASQRTGNKRGQRRAAKRRKDPVRLGWEIARELTSSGLRERVDPGSQQLGSRRGKRGSVPGPDSTSARSSGSPLLWENAVSAWAGPDGDVVVREAEVSITGDRGSREDASLALRAAAVAAHVDLPLARSCLMRLADGVEVPVGRWPDDARDALVATLAAGHAAIDPLEALDQVGVLTRIIPEWTAVRNRPQRNAYHRFTVDRHLLETAANAARRVDRVDRPDLLLIGALLHDIGKGYPGDHTQEGMRVVGDISTRMGFGPADVDTLVSMVRNHLLLADMATRRDLDDPATIDAVAAAVGDQGLLDLLFVLTEADSLATGPSAWGPWKEGLVVDLASRVSERLAGIPQRSPEAFPSEAHRRVMALRRAVVSRDAGTVTVIAPDQPGLLSIAAGLLALHGLDIRSAAARGEDGMAVEVFEVGSRHDRWPDDDLLTREIADAIAGRLEIAERLEARMKEYAGASKPTSAKTPPAEICIENDASVASTVVEVRTADSIGLLQRVTGALFACDLDVVSARVSTIGSEVVDAFYVRTREGAKVLRPEHLEQIRSAVAGALGAT